VDVKLKLQGELRQSLLFIRNAFIKSVEKSMKGALRFVQFLQIFQPFRTHSNKLGPVLDLIFSQYFIQAAPLLFFQKPSHSINCLSQYRNAFSEKHICSVGHGVQFGSQVLGYSQKVILGARTALMVEHEKANRSSNEAANDRANDGFYKFANDSGLLFCIQGAAFLLSFAVTIWVWED